MLNLVTEENRRKKIKTPSVDCEIDDGTEKEKYQSVKILGEIATAGGNLI